MENDTMEKKGWKVNDVICLESTYDYNTWTHIPICEKIIVIGDVMIEAIGKNRGRATRFNDVTLETIDGATRIVKSYDMPYKTPENSMSLEKYTKSKTSPAPIVAPTSVLEISTTPRDSILTAVKGCYQSNAVIDNAIINTYNSSATKKDFLDNAPTGFNKHVVATKLYQDDGTKKLFGMGGGRRRRRKTNRKRRRTNRRR
jgi:hypothetical protein